MLRLTGHDGEPFYETAKFFVGEVASPAVKVYQFHDLPVGPTRTLTEGQFQTERPVWNVPNYRINHLWRQGCSCHRTGLEGANRKIAQTDVLSLRGELSVGLSV